MKAAPEGVAMGDETNRSVRPRSALSDRPADHFGEFEKELAKYDVGWAKAALYFRTDLTEHFGHGNRERRLQGLPTIHERMEVYKKRFERGDTLSLLQAVGMSAEENLPLPTWLALAFVGALHSFTSTGGPNSLDRVFSSPKLPTNTAKKAANAKQSWALGVAIWRATTAIAINDKSVDSLDAALKLALKNNAFGVGATTARELFLMIENNQLEFLGHDKSKALSRILEKRRKG